MTAIKKTKTPKYFDFSTRLRKSAARTQTSQLAIATALKVKTRTVKDWFNGVRIPTEKQMQALSVITKTDYDLLVHGPVVEAPLAEVEGVDAATIATPTDAPTTTEESVEEETIPMSLIKLFLTPKPPQALLLIKMCKLIQLPQIKQQPKDQSAKSPLSLNSQSPKKLVS